MQKQLSFKQKLAWQAVGFVIGSVLFALAGGLQHWT